jgi:hypothetical protein
VLDGTPLVIEKLEGSAVYDAQSDAVITATCLIERSDAISEGVRCRVRLHVGVVKDHFWRGWRLSKREKADLRC